MEIRKTTIEELDTVMAIYKRARQFMAEHDNPTQWGEDKPSRQQIESDILAGKSHVCVEGDVIAAVFYFAHEEDPTYKKIYTKSIQSHTKLVMQSNNILPTAAISIYAIQDKNAVLMNVQGCLNAIHEELGRRNIYSTQYTYAQSVLYRPTHTFQQEEVLYQNGQGYQLKVADLLAVSKYAVSIAEAMEPSNEEYAKANAAITVFQGLDAILNNKPEDKPVNKMLHLATSFISSVVKSSIKDDEAKRGVTITAIMVDLAIDFFCKK